MPSIFSRSRNKSRNPPDPDVTEPHHPLPAIPSSLTTTPSADEMGRLPLPTPHDQPPDLAVHHDPLFRLRRKSNTNTNKQEVKDLEKERKKERKKRRGSEGSIRLCPEGSAMVMGTSRSGIGMSGSASTNTGLRAGGDDGVTREPSFDRERRERSMSGP